MIAAFEHSLVNFPLLLTKLTEGSEIFPRLFEQVEEIQKKT